MKNKLVIGLLGFIFGLPTAMRTNFYADIIFNGIAISGLALISYQFGKVEGGDE